MKITYYPDPLLRQIAKPVEEITPQVLKTLDEMLDFMYVANERGGVGLAAPQIGLSQQLIVIDTSSREDCPQKPLFLINPVITHLSKETCEIEEGCLSLPRIYAPVERAIACRIEYLDRMGKKQKLEDDGFLARVILHEMDHLTGKLFIDYLSPLRRKIISKKLKKLEENY